MENKKAISIDEFLDTKYKDFAIKVVEGRAIPSIVDGFKPTQRKIVHTAANIFKTKDVKPMKVFQLSGKIASDSFYHHGSSSLEDAIINMAQKFKNNMPLLDEIGQFGSLRSPFPAAARYISTKLNDNFSLLYKDSELLEYLEEEGNSIEPRYFLPIIPTVLVNGSSGIAVGFSTNILNRDPIQVIENCIKYLKGKAITNIKPKVDGFNGEYVVDKENTKRWYIRGVFDTDNKSTITIKDIPPTMTYSKYEEILDSLVDKKIIKSYNDNCKNDINYQIKISKAILDELIQKKSIISTFKLEETKTENFTVLNEHGKVVIFSNDIEILKYFVDFRLTFYEKRKKYLVDKYEKEIKIIDNKIKFISAIISKKITINNVKRDNIILDIEKLKLDKIDDSYDYLLRMPIYSLTAENYEKLKQDKIDKLKEIQDISSRDIKQMYLDDLNVLLKNIQAKNK